MTNFETLTKDLDTLADYLAVNHRCDYCPAEFGTCTEANELDSCRLNWRDWLAGDRAYLSDDSDDVSGVRGNLSGVWGDFPAYDLTNHDTIEEK